MQLKWEDVYSVNVKEIDDQHKKIFSIINRFLAVKNNLSRAEFNEMIKELEDYSVYHFVTEEKYFEKYNYSEKKFHVIQHDNYKKIIIDFKNEASSLPDISPELTGKVSLFLQKWWTNHIINEDFKYSDFFNKNGIY